MTKRGMRRLAMLAAGVLVLAVALTAGFLVRESRLAARIEAARQEGMTLYEAEEYEAALGPLSLAVSKDRSDADLLRAYADCRHRVPMPNDVHFSRAIAAARSSLDLDPTNSDTRELLLDLYSKRGWLTELVELADLVIESDGANLRARLLRIEALLRLGRETEARRDADALIEAIPERLISHMRWAEIVALTGGSDETIAAHARSLSDRFGDDPEFFNWLSQIEFYSARRYEASVDAARRAAALPPVSAEQLTRLVDWLERLHDIVTTAGLETGAGEPTLKELATALFERGIADPELGQEVAGQATKRAYWANQTDRAVEFASMITPDEGGLAAWWAGLVLIGERSTSGFGLGSPAVEPYALSARDTAWAVLFEAMDALRRSEPESVPRVLDGYQPDSEDARAVSLYLRGVALQRMGDYRGAATSLREAAESGGVARDRAWRALGDVYLFQGRFDDAQSAYAAMSDNANSRLTRYDFVLDSASRTGDSVLVKQVLRYLDELPESSRSEPSVIVRTARAMILDGRTSDGIELAEQLVGRDPPPDPMGVLGLIRTLDTFAPQVGEELLASLTERSDNIELLASQAAILARAGKLGDARALLGEEIASREGDAALPYRRALLRVVDEVDIAAATAEARQLSDDYEGSATAQLAALQSRGIWQDLAAARIAVTRLREAIGEGSMAWRSYNARAVLAGDPTDEDINGVILDLAAVIRETPDDFDALLLTARAYEQIADRAMNGGGGTEYQEFIDRAAAFYRRASGPGIRTVAFRPLIEMLDRFGRRADASAELDRFVQADADPRKPMPVRQIVERRDLLLRAGRWAEAASDQVLVMGFETPQSVLDLAVMLTRAGNTAGAADVLERFLDHQAWPAPILRRCGSYFAEAGYLDRAIEVFESIDEAEIGESHERMIATALAQAGEPRRALGYQIGLARESGDVDDWIDAILLANSTDDEALITSTLDEALGVFPDAPELRAFAAEDPVRRLALATASSIDSDASGPAAELRAISLAHGRGQTDGDAYVGGLRSIAEGAPEYWPAWRVLANVVNATGTPDDVVKVARDAVAAIPESSLAERQLAQRQLVYVLREQGRLDEARDQARTLVGMTEPDSFSAKVILALISVDLGAYTEVIDLLAGYRSQLEAASTGAPSVGLTSLAIAYAGEGNPSEAYSIFGDHLSSEHLGWQSTALVAALRLPVSETDTAREWLSQITAPEFALDRANAWLRIAEFTGDTDDIDTIRRLLDEHGGERTREWAWIDGRSSAIIGDAARAERAFLEVIELSPDDPAPRAALADLLADDPERTADTIEAVRALRARIGSENPDRRLVAVAATAEARVRLIQDRAADAIAILEPLVDSGAADPLSLAILAKAYLQEGSQNKAAETVDRLRETEPLSARIAAILGALNASESP